MTFHKTSVIVLERLEYTMETIDRRDLIDIEQEYISLSLADLTDDVDCSPSTIQTRENRLKEIEEQVGEFFAQEWGFEAQKLARLNGMASGFNFED